MLIQNLFLELNANLLMWSYHQWHGQRMLFEVCLGIPFRNNTLNSKLGNAPIVVKPLMHQRLIQRLCQQCPIKWRLPAFSS